MISITDETYEFYALSELRGYALDRGVNAPYRHFIERLYQDHVNRFAEQICDYMSVVAFGEALHGRVRCKTLKINTDGKNKKIKSWMDLYPSTRLEVYSNAAKCFDHKQMLESIIELFCNGAWKDGFGGKSWGKIAKLALRYLNKDISPALFIDFAINLHHNGGNVFNKPYLFDDANYLLRFLDYRKNEKSVFTRNMNWVKRSQPISYGLYELLLAWHHFEVFPEYHVPVIIEYPELTGWGNDILEIIEKKGEIYDEDDNLQEDQDDEGENDEGSEEDMMPSEKPEEVSDVYAFGKIENSVKNKASVPSGFTKQFVAGVFKDILIGGKYKQLNEAVMYSYLIPSTVSEGEKYKQQIKFQTNGFSLNCTCEQCRFRKIHLLFKYENDFHNYLKKGGNPTEYKQVEIKEDCIMVSLGPLPPMGIILDEPIKVFKWSTNFIPLNTGDNDELVEIDNRLYGKFITKGD